MRRKRSCLLVSPSALSHSILCPSSGHLYGSQQHAPAWIQLKLRVLTQRARKLASAMVAHDSAQLLQSSHVFPTQTETGSPQISPATLSHHFSNQRKFLFTLTKPSLHCAIFGLLSEIHQGTCMGEETLFCLLINTVKALDVLQCRSDGKLCTSN